MKTYKKEQI